MKRVSWLSRDGLEIPGYLFLPEGEGPFPVIIYVHGGLHASALEDVIPKPGNEICRRYITGRGYAVLMVDYRGSTGYGGEFMSLNEWGGYEIDDVLGAVEYVEKSSIINSRKVFLYGNSRGAYIGLCALERTNRIAAAALSNGLYNLFDIVSGKTLWSKADPRTEFLKEAMRSAITRSASSIPTADWIAECWRRSPVFHTNRVNGRVLIIGSEADEVIPLGCAVELMAALTAARKEVILQVFTGPGATHTFIEHGEPVEKALSAWELILDFFEGKPIQGTDPASIPPEKLWAPSKATWRGDDDG